MSNNQMEYRNHIDPAKNITEHFTWGEHICQCGECDRQWLHRKLYPMLEKLRTALGDRPITITSGYRCKDHNKKIGGATKSQHIEGVAADIKVSGISDQSVVAKKAIELGFTGVKAYKSWTHVDLRSGPVWHIIG